MSCTSVITLVRHECRDGYAGTQIAHAEAALHDIPPRKKIPTALTALPVACLVTMIAPDSEASPLPAPYWRSMLQKYGSVQVHSPKKVTASSNPRRIVGLRSTDFPSMIHSPSVLEVQEDAVTEKSEEEAEIEALKAAIGSRIRMLREGADAVSEKNLSKKMSQRELAEILGFSKQAVRDWEGGESVPASYVLLRIVNHFGVSADWILGRDNGTPLQRIVGRRIRDLREERGVEQRELAQQLGVTTYVLDSWENNRFAPDASQIAILADHFGVSADWILGRIDNRHGIPPILVSREAVRRILEAEHWDELGDLLKHISLSFDFVAGTDAQPASREEWREICQRVRAKVKDLGDVDKGLLRRSEDSWKSEES